jgi:heme O synthase-like polyprenyltransferase
VTETEVRDHIVPTDVMLGPAAVRNQTHTKQIDAKQLRTERRTIARAALRIRYSLLADVVIVASGTVTEIVISAVPIAADARTR